MFTSSIKEDRCVEGVSWRVSTLSVDISELRVPIAQISDLCFTQFVQAVIALAQVALPILPFTINDAATGENQNADLTAQVDRVANWVLWPVSASVCPIYELVTTANKGVFGIARFTR